MDGMDFLFGPRAPKGFEKHWIPTRMRKCIFWRRVGMTARIPRKWLSAAIRPGISPDPEVRSGRRGGTSRAARAVSGLPTGGSGAAPPYVSGR